MSLKIQWVWPLVFVRAVLEYLHLGAATAQKSVTREVVGVFAILAICVGGYVATRALYSRAAAGKISTEVTDGRRRGGISLIGIYSYLALFFFAINMIPLFQRPGPGSIWKLVDIRLAIATAVVLFAIGVVRSRCAKNWRFLQARHRRLRRVSGMEVNQSYA